MTTQSARILIAIANPTLRAQARSALEVAGYTCIERIDGRTTSTAIRRERVDLLLLGLSFPDCDGFALIDRIRALPQGSGLSIIAIAECQCPACQRLLVTKDFTDYLFTPLDDARLRDMVARYLPIDVSREG
jgi:CheY-like chemotaxis protein